MVFREWSFQRLESHRWGTDGVRVENIPRIHNIWPCRRDSKIFWKIDSANQSSSMARSSSCQCSTTLYGEKKEMQRNVKIILVQLVNYARRFLRGHLSFLGPGPEKKWYGTFSDKPDVVCDKTAEDMMLEFADTIHPIFRASCALERGELRSEGGGKKTIHFQW